MDISRTTDHRHHVWSVKMTKMAKRKQKFSETKMAKKKQKFSEKTEHSKKPRNDQQRRPMKSNKKKSAAEDDGIFEEVRAHSLGIPSVMDTRENPDDSEEDLQDTRMLVRQQNRKQKKSGGFQSMGLSHSVFKGVIKKGYKVPTPIQRKTIPLIMDGKDVVAMARTGSGKTAAFLIPMFERLNNRLATGARALIMAPTRELALQTLKFAKEIGMYTGLKIAVVLGGDSMDEQFSAIHENPDILIATPGRFMHVLIEMNLKLSSIEYIVFDEADRLFEMGFQEQLREVLQRVPENRQTVLFSATLPKLLVDFAKAGLHDPTLIRLDVDTKLSENLRMVFLQCQSDNKLAVLLHLLRHVIKPSEQTVIFVATKHHVEYLNVVLLKAGFRCSHSYSSLHPTARKINVAKFRNKSTMILLVTDLAARGIDIPLLDNVINYNFPAKSKLFVHRVGRVARAGMSGMAYSLLSPDEIAYVLDLHLFLGRPFKVAKHGETYKANENGLFGRVPQGVIDDEQDNIAIWKEFPDISSLEQVTTNAYKHYVKSRPAASSESIKRMKEVTEIKSAYHPLFGGVSKGEEKREDLLESMRNFKPKGTIFEINTQKKSQAFNIMKTKRQHHEGVIQKSTQKKQELSEKDDKLNATSSTQCEASEEADITAAFSRVVAPKANTGNTVFEPKKKRKRVAVRDEENYLSYRPKDYQTEKGLSLESNFDKAAKSAAMDITGDDSTTMKSQKGHQKWDRKHKKFVAENGLESNIKKIKTESGQWVSATYKSNIYKDWLSKSKRGEINNSDDDDESDGNDRRKGKTGKRGKKGTRMEVVGSKEKGFQRRPGDGKKFKGGKTELKSKDQMIKQRRKNQKLASFMKHRESKKKRKH